MSKATISKDINGDITVSLPSFGFAIQRGYASPRFSEARVQAAADAAFVRSTHVFTKEIEDRLFSCTVCGARIGRDERYIDHDGGIAHPQCMFR